LAFSSFAVGLALSWPLFRFGFFLLKFSSGNSVWVSQQHLIFNTVLKLVTCANVWFHLTFDWLCETLETIKIRSDAKELGWQKRSDKN